MTKRSDDTDDMIALAHARDVALGSFVETAGRLLKGTKYDDGIENEAVLLNNYRDVFPDTAVGMTVGERREIVVRNKVGNRLSAYTIIRTE